MGDGAVMEHDAGNRLVLCTRQCALPLVRACISARWLSRTGPGRPRVKRRDSFPAKADGRKPATVSAAHTSIGIAAAQRNNDLVGEVVARAPVADHWLLMHGGDHPWH